LASPAYQITLERLALMARNLSAYHAKRKSFLSSSFFYSMNPAPNLPDLPPKYPLYTNASTTGMLGYPNY